MIRRSRSEPTLTAHAAPTATPVAASLVTDAVSSTGAEGSSAAVTATAAAPADPPQGKTPHVVAAPAMAADTDHETGEQVNQLLAAIAAVPTQPQADFIQRQSRLLSRLADRLGCSGAAAAERWHRAAEKLITQQASILLRVALQVQDATTAADTVVSGAAAARSCRCAFRQGVAAAAQSLIADRSTVRVLTTGRLLMI